MSFYQYVGDTFTDLNEGEPVHGTSPGEVTERRIPTASEGLRTHQFHQYTPVSDR